MSHIPLSLILAAVTAALFTWGLTGLYVRTMTRLQRLERPNARSMHLHALPTGAGTAILAGLALPWLAILPAGHRTLALALAGAAAGLMAISWIDDQRPLSPILRLGAQAVAVTVCLLSLPTDAVAAPLLPLWAERALTGLAWLWFINLFNFMDGIDGLAGVETIALAAGYAGLILAAGIASPLLGLALLIAAAACGYLPWNWHPARVLMGDAGAVPLGFLTGWLLIDLALKGLWPAAAILSLYFTADATLTLLRRAWNGKRPWVPHREHFYQQAVLAGASTPSVVTRVAVTNLLLIALALLSIRRPTLALGAAAALIAGLLLHFARSGDALSPDVPADQEPCDAPSNDT
jgi:UDP-N-acetylmuramyl pentapeptide phosphotransferase/UDP-N-acetylglucosamine-1-phosphate transferase